MAGRPIMMGPPPLPRGVARRVSRLARGAHRFHRWSHHPLCVAYQGELVRLGRRARLCRGCAAVAVGGLAGVVAGLTLPAAALARGSSGLTVLGLLGVGGACLAVALGLALQATARAGGWLPGRRGSGSGPRDPGRPARRPGKLVTRALPALAAAALFTVGARSGTAAGALLSAGAAASAAAAWLRYRRRGPDRRPCQACPERTGPAVCSGYRAVARREAAFGRRAARLLSSASVDRPS